MEAIQNQVVVVASIDSDVEDQSYLNLSDDELLDGVALFAARLAGAGCFTETVENLTDTALHALELESYVRVYPNSIQLQPKSGAGMFRIRRFESRLSVNIANKAQAILEAIIENPQNAKHNNGWLKGKVDEIETLKPVFHGISQFLSWVIVGPSVNFLFFDSSWSAFAISFLCSVCTFIAAALVPSISPALETASGFLGAFTSAFISKVTLAGGLYHVDCLTGVVISSIIPLIPGTKITIGVADLISGHTVTGSARLIGALAQSFMQGVAIICGFAAVAWFPTPAVVGVCPEPIDPLFVLLFLPLLCICWSIILDGRISDWPPLFTSAIVSWGSWYGLSRTLPPVTPEIINVIASTIIGIFSLVCHRSLHVAPFSVVVIGMFLLIPGNFSAPAIANSILDQPQAFGISILLIAVEITAGLGIANIASAIFNALRHKAIEEKEGGTKFFNKAKKWQIHLK